MNSSGYNTAEPQLINAISNNGHTVVVQSASFGSLPAGFTSTCVDSVNGYDWLCFFGNTNFSGLTNQIQSFINSGGKVFYQYEVGCCNNASSSVASILTTLTGHSISPNSNSFIALTTTAGLAGWEATNISCCVTFKGNAYKGLDGVPTANQFQATSNLNSSSPPISTSQNFGFLFTTTDFVGTANKGAIAGLGDINVWYDAGEPFSNGGTTPINTSIVDYYFPSDTTTCYILPPGCIETYNPSTLQYDLGNDTTLCQGDTLTLGTTIPNATYLWQDNSTNPTFNVTQPGTYWVQVTTSNCSVTDTIIVNYPTTDLGNDTTLCQGENITLDASTPNATYLWQDNSTNPTFNVTQPGSYWVQVSTNNCSSTDTINVSYTPLPSVDLGNDTTVCQGETFLLDATISNATYLWQDNSTNSTFNVSQPGTYWVQTTVNSCSSTDSINVSYIPMPTVNLGNDTTICQGETILLDATIANASYLWQNNSTNPTFNVTQPGTYWVQVAANNCSSTDTINVSYNQLPTVDLGNDTTLCLGETILLDATSSNATYLWQDNSTNPTFNASQPGTYWVQVTVNSCSSTDSINLSFNPLPTFDLGNDTSLCQGENITLDAITTNATYLWQDNSTNSTFNVTQPGTYWVQVTVNSCSSTDSINVSYNPLPTVDLGNDTSLCTGETLLLDATTSNASYLWQDNSMNPTFNVSLPGTYWVQVTVNSCSSTDTIHLSYNPLPTFDLGNDTSLCQGENLTLDATTTNASYLWQNSSTNSTFNVTQPGTYWVQVTVNSCSSTDSINVTNNPLPTLDLGNDRFLCQDETIKLDATNPNATYLWQDNSTNPTFIISEEGTYWVQVSNSCGTNSDTVSITLRNCHCSIYIPNAFTPNSGNLNNNFSTSSSCDFSEYTLLIFNRWGEKIFETNNPEDSWDGTYRGKISPIGVYAYMVIYQFNESDMPKMKKYGHVNLIR